MQYCSGIEGGSIGRIVTVPSGRLQPAGFPDTARSRPNICSIRVSQSATLAWMGGVYHSRQHEGRPEY